MTRNEGTVDRIGRLILAAAALIVSWLIGGSVGGIVLLVFAAWMLVTAALGYCALYQLLKFSTNPSFHKTSTPKVTVAHH